MVSRLTILCLALLGCPPPPAPPLGEDCDAACLHMQELGCEIGQTTPAGATCWEVCTTSERNGVDWSTACLASAPTCESADEC